MIALVLRSALLLTALFALPILAIRAQPYDDSDLRAFLTPPDGCPAPCFMGIRPGVTTDEEAVAILRKHEWVRNLDTQFYPSGDVNAPNDILWDWELHSPKWIKPRSLASIRIEQNRVASISIVTNIRLGDILLALGHPDKFQVNRFDNLDNTILTHIVWYLDKGIGINTFGICPVDPYYLLVPLLITPDLQWPDDIETTGAAC